MASASASTAIPAVAALRSSSCKDNLSSLPAAWPRNGFSRNLSFSPLSVSSPGVGAIWLLHLDLVYLKAGCTHENDSISSDIASSGSDCINDRSCLAANGRSLRIVAMASGDTSDPNKAVQDFLKSVQDTWEKTDDKLAVGGLGFAALIVLWASAGLIGAIDKLPIIPNFFEFVGILFTGWFIYRYLLFKPDREELLKKVESAAGKITGNESKTF